MADIFREIRNIGTAIELGLLEDVISGCELFSTP